jgi:hypothetical protein
MTIPSLQNLIVCAFSTQSAPRHFVLAAVASSVLCGAAGAQSAPAAPPLSLWPAVEISRETAAGEVFYLERSLDLADWTGGAEGIFAAGGRVNLLEPLAEGRAAGYWRLRSEMHPETGLSRWSLQGCSMEMNRAGIFCRLSFLTENAGTMQTGAELRPFTWSWRRTGMDAGTLLLTWADGSRFEEEIRFLSSASGVYAVQEREAVTGAFAGAGTGTFRIGEAEPGAAAAPLALENVRIDFTGSGRATSLRIGVANALERSTPFGQESCFIQYSRTGDTTALLHLTNGPVLQSIELTFTAAGGGTCLTREFRSNVLRRESEGTFLISPQP